MKVENLVVFGATSSIGQEVCRLHAPDISNIVLCGRDPEKLEIVASDLRCRGDLEIITRMVNFSDPASYEDLVPTVIEEIGSVDIWYFFQGSLLDQKRCENSIPDTRDQLQVNLLSVLDLLNPIAIYLEGKGAGAVVVVTSVAGDRGRKSNYIYGTAKGALSIYLQGLRNRLANCAVLVLEVKPGFVRTPMTEHLDTTGLLWSSPSSVAEKIVSAIKKKRDVVYIPGYWRLIMFVINAIPEKIFKRLNL